MSPQARAKLPPELGRLTRKDMEAVIYQANLGRENEKIAQLYFVDKLPQVDVAEVTGSFPAVSSSILTASLSPSRPTTRPAAILAAACIFP